MERLTTISQTSLIKCCGCIEESDCYENSCGEIKKAISKLREYENLKEQGLLLKLPCKVGDTVYCIHMYSGGGRVPNWGEIFKSNFSVSMYDDFGKTVFLTQAEAEEALERMDK